MGSGAAGLTAAITAHEHGLSVLVLEKSPMIGGVAAISGGQLWVPANHLAEEAGIADSVEEGLAYLMWIGGGYGDEVRRSEVLHPCGARRSGSLRTMPEWRGRNRSRA